MSLVRRSFVPLLLGLMVLLLQGATIQAQVRTQINLSTTVDCLSQVVVADHTTRDKLTAISALSPSDAWAVGPNQLAYHWDGSMWTVVTLPPAPSGSAAQPYTVVSMIASNDVWAIQNYFQSDGVHTNTQIVHWDGSSWSVVPNPQPGSLLNDLNGVKALAPNDVWAVGSSGNSDGVRFTVTLHWNGSIWSQVPSPSPGMVSDILEAVDGRASNDVWAVGSPADTMVLHWNGNVWSLFSIPNSSTANHLHSVSMIASNDVWAVGDVDSAGVPSAYAAHWDGNTWTQVPVPQVGSSSSLMGVKALFATEVYAVGNYISNVEKTLGFRWNGSEWTQITADSPSVGAYFTAVDGGGGSNLWAVGTHQISNIRSSVLIEQPCLASTPSPTQTPTVTTTSTAGGTTPTPTATVTRSATPTLTATPTASVGATQTPTATATVSAGATQTPTATATTGAGTTQSPVPVTYTPTTTPTIGAYCANVVWTRKINTSVDSAGHLRKTGGQDGLWDAGAVSTLGITSAPACYRVDPGMIALGTDQVIGLTHNEQSPGYDDIDYGFYLSATGRIGIVESGRLLPSTVGNYAAGDGFQIAVEGVPQVVNYYHNQTLVYTSTVPAQLPLFADVSIATLHGDIAPSRVCSNGPPNTTPTATQTLCPTHFSDVTDSTAYYYQGVYYLACHGALSGYSDGTFRPFNTTTRGQMTKIVTLADTIPLVSPPAGGTFADVDTSNVFYQVVETAVAHGLVSGYTCGGTNPQTAVTEPCDSAHRPYFRPSNFVTRGQLTKIVVIGAGWTLQSAATPTFNDVAGDNVFYPFIETAVCHGTITGYIDSTFRPNNNAFRSQIAKIVYLAVTNPAAACGLQP